MATDPNEGKTYRTTMCRSPQTEGETQNHQMEVGGRRLARTQRIIISRLVELPRKWRIRKTRESGTGNKLNYTNPGAELLAVRAGQRKKIPDSVALTRRNSLQPWGEKRPRVSACMNQASAYASSGGDRAQP